ncbi:hypothetical protein MJT46_010029 [Ovis ammon polii x Ovis aries]|nr:hypothetical protein MJT46_010029 [Ovis ammon polii x Ovis aries]
MNEMESLQRKTLNTTVCFHQGGEQEVARTPKGQVSTLVRVQEPGPSSSPQMADITPLSPEEPGVNIRLYDLLGPVRELDMKRRQVVANHHVHTEHKLCKLMTHAVLTWTGDPQALGTLPPQTVSLHHQLRRKSNKELEDFHGSQALDGGRRHQAASDREPWKPRGSRDAPGAAKPRVKIRCFPGGPKFYPLSKKFCKHRLVFGKDSEEPVNLASSLLLIISIYDVAAGKCGYENLENRVVSMFLSAGPIVPLPQECLPRETTQTAETLSRRMLKPAAKWKQRTASPEDISPASRHTRTLQFQPVASQSKRQAFQETETLKKAI